MNLAATTSKGSATREMILARAYAIACRQGLEGLSIGELANAAGMSKSGVFAHFGSREELQLTVLDWTAARFGEAVMGPALRQPRGQPRLRALMHGWFDWICANPDGCVMLGVSGEYDGRPGPLQERVVSWLGLWRAQLGKAIALCIETGELRADTDANLLAFQLLALAHGLHDTRIYDTSNTGELARRALAHLLDAHSS